MDRFVVIALPRSGSTLTVEMLNAHPAVCCENQIFAPRWRDNPRRPNLFFRKVFPLPYARKRAAAFPHFVYGFKLIFNEVFFMDKTLLEFNQQGWKFVFISRSNYLRQAISLLIARSHRQWHQRSEIQKPIARVYIDLPELLRELNRIDIATSRLKASINLYSHLAINYENDLEDSEKQKKTLIRLCDYFCIPPYDPKLTLQKIHTSSIQDYVENYDEIINIVSSTKYSIFL